MSKRILVVEDQADNRQIIRNMLAPTDYEITEAENGEEALAAIAKQRPDLILMDIQLPPRANSEQPGSHSPRKKTRAPNTTLAIIASHKARGVVSWRIREMPRVQRRNKLRTTQTHTM